MDCAPWVLPQPWSEYIKVSEFFKASETCRVLPFILECILYGGIDAERGNPHVLAWAVFKLEIFHSESLV
jgi:hypothetical protein